MGWFSRTETDDRYERSLQRQQELAREEAAERRRETVDAARAARLTRDHDRPAVWVNPGRR